MRIPIRLAGVPTPVLLGLSKGLEETLLLPMGLQGPLAMAVGYELGLRIVGSNIEAPLRAFHAFAGIVGASPPSEELRQATAAKLRQLREQSITNSEELAAAEPKDAIAAEALADIWAQLLAGVEAAG